MTDLDNWNTKIIDEFRTKGGKGVAEFGDALLLLHHTGARSGVERVNPLAYFDDGDRLVIVASRGGAPQNPDWFYNLRAHPDTTIEIGTATRAVRAVEITGEDYERTWARVIAAMPGIRRLPDEDDPPDSAGGPARRGIGHRTTRRTRAAGSRSAEPTRAAGRADASGRQSPHRIRGRAECSARFGPPPSAAPDRSARRPGRPATRPRRRRAV